MQNNKNGNENKTITVLGSTGSVGRQALDVAEAGNMCVSAISAAGKLPALIEEQVRRYGPELCAVTDEAAAADLKVRLADTGVRIVSGKDAASQAAAYRSGETTVVNAVSGFAGLAPTLAAIEAGARRVALANKESLVAAGELVMKKAAEHGTEILPVDSEHCAVFQCLFGGRENHGSVRRLILTASGGPFRGMEKEKIDAVTPELALAHPTWKMGAKITIDCATMMNKGLEVIEAARLFSFGADEISVVVHPQSIVHSMVEYIDGAVIAQMGVPDMRHCISYAVNYPNRAPSPVDRLDLTKIMRLEFFEPENEKFPLLPLAFRALRAGGTVPAFLSGANEAAVALFLGGAISFGQISEKVSEAVLAYESTGSGIEPTLSAVIGADAAGRAAVTG